MGAVALGLGTIVMSHRIARQEALRDAQTSARAMADALASPGLDVSARSGTALRGSTLDRLLSGKLRDGSVSHVNVWSPEGVVLWSDDKDLVGRRFVLASDVSALFGGRGALIEPPEHETPVSGSEPTYPELLEVYVSSTNGFRAPSVEPT